MASGATNQRWRAIKTISWGLAAVVAVSLFNRNFPAVIQYLELIASDLRVYQRARPMPTGVVAIATADDKSIAELGRFPWARSVEARLLGALMDYKAAVVGFDMTFSERDPADVEREAINGRLKTAGVSEGKLREALGISDDLAFARAIRSQGSTYLGYFFNSHLDKQQVETDLSTYRTTFLEPPPLAYNIVRKGPNARQEMMVASAYLPPISALNSAARGIAYVDIDEDADGIARTYPTVVRLNGRYCVPLFLALTDAYMHDAPLSLDLDADGVGGVAIGNKRIPVDQAGNMMVHYRGKAGTIPRYSIADIIDHRLPADTLRGRIVVVGVTAHALGDRFRTPIGGDYPGVEIQATAVDNVLGGDFIHRSISAVDAEEKWAGWILGVAISMVGAFMTALSSAVVLVILAAGYISYATWRLTSSGALVGVVFPLGTLALTYLVIVSYRYVAEGKEKRFLRSAFEKYVNPDYVASLINDPSGLKLGGERRHLSILFADILNFTTRAEQSEPEPLVALLNTYMTVMVNIILESGGVVDKLMGDGIMAFWGAPLPVENPARDAVNCALKMHEELNALAQRDDRFKDVRIGVGIATGEVIVGNFGGEDKFDYSVIGDTVNLASRLEGLTRQFKVKLLVNRQTYEEAGACYIVRELGLVKVKGKDQLVPVVEIAAHEGDGADPAFYRRFADAIALMQSGYSPEADLRTLLKERPDDQVIALCLERLQTADGHPAREMVFEFDTK
jgi:adenylate cyclase